MRGGRCIIGPDGGFLADPAFNQSGFFSAEIDLRKAISEKIPLDIVNHDSRPDIISLKINNNRQKNV
jgi:nitrilase